MVCWKRQLFSEYRKITLQPLFRKIADCRYDACIVIPEVMQLDDAMCEVELTGGKYVIHRVKHTAEAIQKAWTEIFPLIKENKYQIVDKPILERYTADMICEGYCEICVPVTVQTTNIEQGGGNECISYASFFFCTESDKIVRLGKCFVR